MSQNGSDTIESATYKPLTNGPREAILSDLSKNREEVEDQVFKPIRHKVLKVDVMRRFLRPVYILHLENGLKLHFDPAKPGFFVFKKDRQYVRAMYLKRAHINNVARMVCHPRFRYMHRFLKFLFPVLAVAGIKPTRLSRVFTLDQNTFNRFYQKNSLSAG